MLYHVTFTRNIRSIRKFGIFAKARPSNWVRSSNGEPYGAGYIFAFDHLDDAVVWAGKMGYEFFRKSGKSDRGKLSIVGFEQSRDLWRVDGSDPLTKAACKGRWLKSYGPVAPHCIEETILVTKEMVRLVISDWNASLARIPRESREIL